MEKLKIVFIGGLSDGIIVYNYLNNNKYVEIPLVITYPDDGSKPRHVNFPDQDNIIKSGRANAYAEKIMAINPDYIFVAGWSELLKEDILNSTKKGVIGFHPSKLPFDRGRSVIAWQIEEGYTETALSMFYYTDIPDEGEIIAQERIAIEENDYLNDILDKVDEATINIMRAYFPLLRMGKAPRKPQSVNEGNFRRLRKTRDSQIDWKRNKEFIYNKIRAISKPYPGAEGMINGQKYKIYKAEIINDFSFGNLEEPGTLIATLFDNSMIVKCRNGYIRAINHELMS